MSSRRFPGKVLAKIYKNQNVFDIIINELKKIRNIFLKFSKIKKNITADNLFKFY